MTNGEKLCIDFPNVTTRIFKNKIFHYIEVDQNDKWMADINIEWWNSEYKEPTTKNDVPDINVGKIGSTTKNDLVVDWDSYKDVDGNSLDDLILEVLQNNFDCGNTYGYKVADEIIGLLPPATPQEPRKGHWVLTDVEGDKVWHCNCSECGKDPQDYVGGSENWWLIKSKLPKFCPNCGSDNREVKE